MSQNKEKTNGTLLEYVHAQNVFNKFNTYILTAIKICWYILNSY